MVYLNKFNDLSAKALSNIFIVAAVLDVFVAFSGSILNFVSAALLSGVIILWPLSVRNSFDLQRQRHMPLYFRTAFYLFLFILGVLYRTDTPIWGFEWTELADGEPTMALIFVLLACVMMLFQFFSFQKFCTGPDSNLSDKLGWGLYFVFMFGVFPVGIYKIVDRVGKRCADPNYRPKAVS